MSSSEERFGRGSCFEKMFGFELGGKRSAGLLLNSVVEAGVGRKGLKRFEPFMLKRSFAMMRR